MKFIIKEVNGKKRGFVDDIPMTPQLASCVNLVLGTMINYSGFGDPDFENGFDILENPFIIGGTCYYVNLKIIKPT